METSELTNIIYDTLMRNTQHPQFDTDSSTDEFVNDGSGDIFFTYNGVNFKLSLEQIN